MSTPVSRIGNIVVNIEVKASGLRRWTCAVLACCGMHKLAWMVLKPAIHVSTPYFKRTVEVD